MIEILADRARRRARGDRARLRGPRYGDFKTAVGDEVADWLAPVRERYAELRGDEAALEDDPRGRGGEGARDRVRHARRRARGDGGGPGAALQPAPGVIRRAGA